MKKGEVVADKINYQSLIIDHVVYQTNLTKKYSSRKSYTELVPGVMTAFIPGTITEVYVKEGQKVAEGDPLVVLEAMKMLNEIRAPFAGEVKSVNVKKGEHVVKNYVLVEVSI
ncbi:MAG: biotin/lipoyl-binding protein [Bacteroidales bacterium]|nr:biotin/lipoyl-binding protein [Bacteroidales bacterium]HOI32342.1 biotin/lipoyl-binding protein [Bacteroidales bacterium]